MFPCTIKMFIKTVCLFIAVTLANGQDRHLVSLLNPGCEDCNPSKSPLIYTRAQGSHDTIHQIWDFTDHVPAVVYLIGRPNSTLDIMWKKSQPDKFQFSDSPNTSYSFAAAIESIIEYNDLKDNGQYDPDIPKRDKRYWPLDWTTWTITDKMLTDREAMVMLRGEEEGRPGVMEMKLDILPFTDYAVELPHLIHTANSTLVDIRLVNYTEYRHFNSSRFALRFVLVSSDQPGGSWTKDMRKSLDDEHTPGVFEIIEIKSSRADGAFVQFRPVAYTEPERGVSSSTDAYITSFNKTGLPSRSILRDLYRDYFQLQYYYRDNEPVDLVIQDAVVSFGLGGDGFYKHHNFTAWSFSVGYGAPPMEGFSVLVVVIISIGVGAPALLALAGAGYLLLRRCRRGNPPARFTDDD